MHEVRLGDVLVELGFLTAADRDIEDQKQRYRALSDAFSRWAYDHLTRDEQKLWPEL